MRDRAHERNHGHRGKESSLKGSPADAHHLAIADDWLALADICQRGLVALQHEGAQGQAASKCRARRNIC
jgi:hypothetical protein